MELRAFAFAVFALFFARFVVADDVSAGDFDKFARGLREKALTSLEPKITVPQVATIRGSSPSPWKLNIVTVLFHVGEHGDKSSAWDANWAEHFGGFDNPDPDARRDFMPVGFVPKLNPFYFALPYNDLTKGHHKPEARTVIPWFRQAFEQDGQSVCRDRWIAIRKGNRVCYAQWGDVGPRRSDHWKYVFGNELPKPNTNAGAGLSVSPAVRDYLGMGGTDVTDWKFVDSHEVPPGPWARIGQNNTAAQRMRATKTPANPEQQTVSPSDPTVLSR